MIEWDQIMREGLRVVISVGRRLLDSIEQVLDEEEDDDEG